MTCRVRRVVGLLVLLPFLHLGCRDSSSVDVISVSLKNADTYHYPTVSGDEDGARMSIQAEHYSISEIRRDAETQWVAVYVYRPSAGYVGADYAEIEIFTGSDGASAPTRITRIGFRFDVHN